MVRLREIPRTAAFAWSPGNDLPSIATGTKAGAIDADFSTETLLEIWDLELENHKQNLELVPAGRISTDSRFYDIAWGKLQNGRGIIAGALENGSLDLWDASKLLDDESDAFMSRTSKHSGAIKSLQFNPFRPELLATAGAKGELFISDLNNVANPFRLGTSAARADDLECVDWNKKVPHILVTGSGGGFVTVWDVKAKKESLTLNNLGRKIVSAVAWDPAQSTKLATAVSDDANPLILVWDLRNSNAPERVLKSHEQGVLSLSWCQQDSDLLLSCGKDNRTICWNPQTGEPYGEFPIVTNWTFQTRWNPHHPNLLATASFDGKIGVQTIQNTKPAPGGGAQTQKLDGEDFFNNAQTEPQTAAFTLPKPPKWLERPVGASFGFGGKVVSFGRADTTAGAGSRRSTVRISQFSVDGGVGSAITAFEKALAEGDLAGICQARIAEAKTDEEKADWEVLQTLISDNPKKKLIEFLDFSNDKDESSESVPRSPTDKDEVTELKPIFDQGGMSIPVGPRHHRLSSFFDSNPDGDSFLSGLSATKGVKTNNPFHIYTGSESAADRQITNALLLGQFERALDVCIREDRMSDAFMVAICGGQKCIDKAQAAYLSKQSKGPNYLRLLASVVGKNLWDVVYNADMSNWKEIMATLCTFATQEEFSDLCEALGDRLEDELKNNSDNNEWRKNASFCYLAGSKLEKVVTIWIEETQQHEAAGLEQKDADSTFSIHARSLQSFIEKVTVFREVTKFQDTDRNQSSGWKLSALYDRYTEYADVVAAQGFLDIAEKYLDLLPPQYGGAEVARNRVKQATRKTEPKPAAPAKQATLPNRSAQRTQPTTFNAGSTQQPVLQSQGPSNPYAPAAPMQSSNQAMPQGGRAYTPVGYQQPQNQQQMGGYYQQGQPLGVPPRNLNASPSVPPPSRATDMANWNDTPMVAKPPTARRGTPSAGGPAPNPYANQQQQAFQAPPPVAPYSRQQRATPPLAPPPKGSAPPIRMTPPNSAGMPPQHAQQPERPPSVTRSPYMPPPGNQAMGGMPTPTIPRGPSPYNAPPSGPAPSNRYAPAAPPQGANYPDPNNRGMAAPPQGAARPPQQNPYAPQQQNQYSGPPMQQGPPQMNALPPQQQAPMQQQQYQGPPQAVGAGDPPPQPAKVSTPAPAPSKYPPGDRSHIPPHAQSIYEILNSDMQRVKAKAPASFAAQVKDTEKRLNLLFDHLNNETLLKPDTIQSMEELAQALAARDYETAQAIQVDLHTNKLDQCGQWMVGVKRLIGWSKATP